ncbi:MAG: hypothetical protein ACOCZ6_02360 [Nanoarchaeota archaeon]
MAKGNGNGGYKIPGRSVSDIVVSLARKQGMNVSVDRSPFNGLHSPGGYGSGNVTIEFAVKDGGKKWLGLFPKYHKATTTIDEHAGYSSYSSVPINYSPEAEPHFRSMEQVLYSLDQGRF